MKYSDFYIIVVSVISRIRTVRNDVQREGRPQKIIIHLQSGQEIALFFKLKHFKSIILIKTSL